MVCYVTGANLMDGDGVGGGGGRESEREIESIGKMAIGRESVEVA
jgi:hypothetical protein